MIKSTFLKSWLLLLCMIVGSSAAWADEVTVNMSEQGYSNADNVSSITNGGLTISFTDGSTATAYYATGTAVRIYGGGSATFSVKDATISKVELTFSGTSNAPSANTVWSCTDGSGSGTSGASATWTGSAKTVIISRPTGSGHWRLQSVTVTYTPTSLDNSVATTITIDDSGITNKDLYAGTNAGQLAAIVKDINGASISGATVTWASSKEDVATVAADGTVTLVAAGTTVITASYAGEENQYKPSTANYELIVTDSTPQTGEWVLTDLADLTANDVFVIIGEISNNLTTYYHALTNDNGTSGAPAAPNLTVENEKLSRKSGNIADNIKWNISGDATNGYTFYPNGSTTTWLYCNTTASSSSNNNMRVGAGDRKVFVMDNNGILKTKDTYTVRYLSIYGDQDWRGYINTDLAPKVTFYKYVDGTVAPTPRISADNVNIAYDATSGSIEFTIANPANDGVMTATTTDSWLTLGTVGTTVPFTTTANDESTERTATVTLTYTYNTSETVTKTVTITQAAAPMIYKTIPALYAAATSTATDVTISFGGWVVSGVKNKNAYLTDNQGNGLIIYTDGHGFQVNDVLTGTASCKLLKYNGSAELTNITSTTDGLTVATGGTVTAQNIAISALSGVNTGALLSFTGLTYNGTELVDADNNTIKPYNTLYEGTFENGKEYNIKGIYLQYNDTKELLPRSADDIEAVVSTTPTLDVSPANVTVPYTGGSGDFTVTANNVNNAIGAYVTFYDPTDTETSTDEPSWIFISYDYENLSLSYTITDENQTGADRTACFKYYIICDNGGALSNLITVTQQTYVAPTVAALPFEFNDGKADIEDTDGLTQEGIGSDYSASPKLKFDTTGDWLLLHFDERPGILTFDIKNNSFSGGTFTVQTSEDGVTYTDLEAYTTITGTQNEEFDNLDENVRYIKWIYTNKSNGNVGLGNIKLAKYAAPAPSITIAATDAQVNVDAAGGDGNISFTYENLAVTDNNDFDVVFFDADDNEINQPGWIQAEVNAIDNIYYVVDANTDAAARTAYLKVHAIDDENNDVYSNVVTITQEGVPPVVTKEYFVKVTNTSDLTDGQYLIVNEENGIAFDGSLTTLDAVGNNKEVVVSENIALAETSLIFTYDANAKTLKSASGYYIGQTSDANGLASNKTTTYENAISFDDDGNANIVSGSAYLRYNAASNADRFRYYKSSSYTNQKPVQLYKLTTTTPTVAVTITDAGYATYCSAYNLDFSNVSDLTAYEATINGTTVAFNEGDKIFAAGEGILLKGDKGTYNIPVVATATVNTNNKLVGVLAEEEVAAGIYVLLNTNNNPGFYKTKSAFTVGAHTAYLPAIAGARDFIGIDDNTTTGVNSIDNGQWTMDNVYNLNGQRVNNAKKGLYIVNGKKVVIK